MKISIVTVSYNSEKTISDTMNSVYNQTYEDIEYIVIDGKSSDNTISIIKEQERKFNETGKTFRWISEKDKGIYDAINKGIKMATGDVVGFLNSDDFYANNDVVKDIAAELSNESIDCVYGNMKYIDPESNKVVRDWVSKDYVSGLFEKSWTPGHPTFYCKKKIYTKYGLYKTDYKIAADVELMYRFIEKNKVSSSFINKYFVTMRQGGVSSSGLKSTITITKEMIKAFEENGEHLNIIKYLFYKGLKLKEFLIKNN